MAVKKRPPPVEAPRLRPAAAPVNTYVRPPAPALAPDAPARSDLFQLASALGNLSPRLADWAKSNALDPTGESEALGLRLRTANQELADRIRRGDIPPEVNRAKLELGHGEDQARKDFEDIRARYQGQSTSGDPASNNAFDRNSGDLDAWFKTVVQEKEQQLPQNPNVLHGWRRLMTGYQKGLYEEHDRYVAQRTKDANLDAAYKDLYGVATTEIANGQRDPAGIHAKMREAFPQVAKLHLLTPDETNAAMATVAKSIAEQGIPGNPMLGVALVREIYLGQRGDLPPLGNTAKYAHLANQTIETAQKTAGEQQRKLATEAMVAMKEDAVNGRLDEQAFLKFTTDNPHIMSEKEREAILFANRQALEKAREEQAKLVQKLALRAQADASEAEIDRMLAEAGDKGTVLSLPQKVSYLKSNGETGEYAAKTLQDRAAENFLKANDEWARQQRLIENEVMDRGATPVGPSIEQRKFDREFDWFQRNQLVHPIWKDKLNAGYAAASPEALASNNPPPVLLEAAALYEQLQAKSPGLLERHLTSDNAKDFYATYRVARTLMRHDERQALITAALATKQIGDETPHAIPYKKLEEQLGKAQSIWPWAASVTNFGDMRDDIKRLGRAFVRAGVSPEDAAARAGDEVAKHYTNVNGYMVKTSDRHVEAFGTILRANNLLPRGFDEVVKDYLEDFSKRNPDIVGEESSFGGLITTRETSLSIRPTTEGFGTWAIVDATSGLPVPSVGGARAVIGLRDLLAFERDKQSGEQQKKIEDIKKRSRPRATRAAADEWTAGLAIGAP